MNKEGRVIIVIPIFLTIIFLFTPVFAYDTHVAHPNLTEASADLFNMHFGNRVSAENKKYMADGAIAEDTPIRWMNHFYEPNTGEGLLGFQTAKSWAQSADTQKLYAKGDQSWQTAINEFAEGNNKQAFIALGHVLHLIEDMTVPAHTRLDIHIFNGGDPYEQWVKNNYYLPPNIFPSISNNLNYVFDTLAMFSNKNFFSEDTIDYEKIKANKIIFVDSYNGEIAQCVEGQINQTSFCLVKYKKDGFGSIEYSFGNPVNSDYFSLLAPKAISYGAGVIKLFFDTAEPLKEKRQVDKNKLLKSLINYGQNLFFTPAFAQTNPNEYLRLATFAPIIQTPSANPKTVTIEIAPTTTPKNSASPAPTSPILTPAETQSPTEQWPVFLPEIYPDSSSQAGPNQQLSQQPALLPLFSYHIPSYTSSASKKNQETTAPKIEPKPPATPILNPIFSELIFTSTSPINIFGECDSEAVKIKMFFADGQEQNVESMELIETFSASGSAWSVSAPLQYGNNIYYFSAINAEDLSSELSKPASIVLDNVAPEALFENITTTSTEESARIELSFSASDTFSEENCFDLGVSVNTSTMVEVLNCANVSQFIFETEDSGEIHFYLRAKDKFGNYSEWITTSTYVEPPEVFVYNYLNGKQIAPEVILTKEGSPYILQNYTVPVGKVLRIEPGAVIKGQTRRSMIYVEGKLFAQGSVEDPIYFTSLQDRSFDSKKLSTTDLGEQREPRAQDWSAVSFYRAEGIFDNVIFRYGGTDHFYPCLSAVMMCDTNMEVLFFSNSTIVLNRVLIEKTGPGIMSSSRTDLSITDSTIDGLADGVKADYGIRSVRGKLNLDNVILKNLKIGIDARTIAPATTITNMTENSFLNVDNFCLPETLISL